ncbi:MAG: hypothetical protein ABSA06_04240 [Geobacteraceae bacterium]
MKPIIKYIEHKPAEHTDRGEAWIARVWPSSSGKTLYFNDMALKQCSGNDCNHFDLVTGESYWLSGVKKRGSNRHWGGGGPIQIEQSIVEWYQKHVQFKEYCDLIVIPDLPKPDISQFDTLENRKL